MGRPAHDRRVKIRRRRRELDGEIRQRLAAKGWIRRYARVPCSGDLVWWEGRGWMIVRFQLSTEPIGLQILSREEFRILALEDWRGLTFDVLGRCWRAPPQNAGAAPALQ